MEAFGTIPVFVAVVENGGFSAAARSLGVSKSAVSKRINQLEAHLGVRLLHRTTRKLSLTEAGERYFEHAAQALTDLLAELTEEGCTVLLTTHNLERGVTMGQRVVVLTRGRLVYDERGEAINPATFPDTYRALTA